MSNTQTKSLQDLKSIGNGKVSLEIFSDNGDIYELNANEAGVTLSSGNKLDTYSGVDFFLDTGGGNRISLLRKSVKASYGRDSLCWIGKSEDIDFGVRFRTSPDSSLWFWTIELLDRGQERYSTDLTYYMDKGLAPRRHLQTNEFYNCHYIDTSVMDAEKGERLLVSRQNLSVFPDGNPQLVEGCSHRISSYATDSEDFFGSSFRTSGLPEGLSSENLPSRVRQGQYAISALRTERFILEENERKTIVFWGAFLYGDDCIVSSEEGLAVARKSLWLYGKLTVPVEPQKLERGPDSLFAKTLSGSSLNEMDLNSFFGGNKSFCEYDDKGDLISFFQKDKHIILKEKDRYMPVSSGHILRTGQQIFPDDNILSMTCYMNGCFSAQMAMGNSYFNSFMTHPRSIHDLFRANGLRIAMDRNNYAYEILTVPSAYILSNYSAEWIYKVDDGLIVIKAEADQILPRFVFSLRTEGNLSFSFRIFAFLKYGEDKSCYNPSICIENKGEALIEPHPASLFGERFKGVKIRIKCDDAYKNKTGFPEEMSSGKAESQFSGSPCVVFDTGQVDEYSFSISCEYSSESDLVSRKGIGYPVQNFLQIPVASGPDPELNRAMEKLNLINSWFAHNALMHFSVLHGLEQTKGAAWGIRDVLQGPFEALLAQEDWAALREVIKLVFTAQYIEDGTWPQWFMLDSYHDIRDKHAHGDVIFWPLKALCEYIEESSDLNFLSCAIPYTERVGMEATDFSETVIRHLGRLLEAIERDYLVSSKGFIKYGNGDWNDTLQPRDGKTKGNLVSVWTMGLAVQYLKRLELIIDSVDFPRLFDRIVRISRLVDSAANEIADTYNPLPGFLLMGDRIKPFIHPDDGMNCPSYRLLPMIRFINARIFTESQARNHLKIIEEKLWHPDGVKLLDCPVPYKGGRSETFLRAEQSSFWGREVGLMYVHAHLRFIEALLSLGEAEKAWKAINQIIPIELEKTVFNGAPRQVNAYFSSSDAAFLNRYEAEEQYDLLAQGKISCNGGWRIYSSGPGIFLSLIKRWFFGYRYDSGYTVIDPVIPASLSGISLSFTTQGDKKVTLKVLSERGESCGVKKIIVNGIERSFIEDPHPYRRGGGKIQKEKLREFCNKEENEIIAVV